VCRRMGIADAIAITIMVIAKNLAIDALPPAGLLAGIMSLLQRLRLAFLQ
jgi:hypothetical protein